MSEKSTEQKYMQNPPPIFRLNIDCFHEIFEWLHLHDLTAIGKTCRRLQQVAGDFYRSNYVSKRIIAENGGSYILYRKINIFTSYIEKISISGNSLKVYDFVGTNCKSINEIRLGNGLSKNAIECIKDVLKKVGVIEMHECLFRHKFYDHFLKYCPKLKNLSVKRSDKVYNKSTIIGSDNDWLLRNYPMLEHIELTEIYELENNGLKTFFELNPNIKTFSIDSESFEENRNSFLTCDTKLNKLAIEFSNTNASKRVHDMLEKLHEKEFYKRLHVYFRFDPQENLDQMLTMPFSRSLEGLHFEIPWLPRMINIDVCLKNLKVLGINKPDFIMNIDALPSKLPNLEQIYFGEANPIEIWPFICGSSKLKTIKILNIVQLDRIYSFGEFPDLTKMNKERRRLAGARRVTIYIHDRLMLVSKWMKKATKLDLIELRRFESLEWNELNSHFKHNHSTHYF